MTKGKGSRTQKKKQKKSNTGNSDSNSSSSSIDVSIPQISKKVMASCSTPVAAGMSNRFDSLYMDAEEAVGDGSFLNGTGLHLHAEEPPMPDLPNIPNANLLSEIQKQYLVKEKLPQSWG